ncbi:hypothetical protein HCA69_12380 [Listeria grandensis]|uniref:Uncharacterized protein n=1 Tax=Listeria grandensis TaxID=1494963 RepID=A0A7X0Y592_9LIST|nr:hypothetical protein [Listeria grandensis]MBC1937169.1 hypothetical protein [Listeria grandensis]
MNFKEQLQKDREEAFEVWYQRYKAREDLKKEFRISAAQGYTGYSIDCLEGYDSDVKRRKCSDEFLEHLKKDFPDLDIRRETGTTGTFVNIPFNKIHFFWGESE